ncbi:hypothetical protein OIU79_019056 [Salix purpurea]|uniref:Uncharacterized protein n=1 Tax=Salix purpurea TaxID=77065 RepID=A0A9Q0SIP2_SALPP|nr:hypothetical protein OIU79_019056 [Salix purpurea]
MDNIKSMKSSSPLVVPESFSSACALLTIFQEYDLCFLLSFSLPSQLLPNPSILKMEVHQTLQTFPTALKMFSVNLSIHHSAFPLYDLHNPHIAC